MDTMEFVTNYNKYVKEIRTVINSNLLPVINEFKDKDPHKLLTPDSWSQMKMQQEDLFGVYLLKL